MTHVYGRNEINERKEHSVGLRGRDNIKGDREYMGWVTWGAE
jgi:hypothetical protein